MSTPSISQTTATRHESELTENLPGVIERLANMAPSVEVPYLTAYVAWQPDGGTPGRRSGLRLFGDAGETVLEAQGERTPLRDHLEAGIARITGYLEEGAPDEAHGIMVVAGGEDNVFEAIPLGVPVPTELNHGPVPALRTLLRSLNDFPSFAVLQSDEHEANIYVVRQGRTAAELDIESTDSNRNSRATSGKETTIQNRENEQAEAFVREVGDKLRIALDRGNLDGFVLVGDAPIESLLEREVPKQIWEHLIGRASGSTNKTSHEAVAQAMPVVLQQQREREVSAVTQARDLSRSGGPGVAGLDDTLAALQSGQVEKLVINDDFNALGWADYTFPVYGSGLPHSEHPAGGDPVNMVSVSMPDELVRLAIQFSADVELVHTAVPISAEEIDAVPDAHGDGNLPRADAAKMLDDLGGVAAILRFALADNQQTTN